MRKINIAIACFAILFGFHAAFNKANAQIPANEARLIQPAKTETVAEIMQRQSLSPGTVDRQRREMEGPNRKNLKQNPFAPAISSYPPRPQENGFNEPPTANVAQTPSTSFNGVTGPDETGAYPPDDMGAIGPTQYIVFVNGRLRSFNKTTGVADGVLNANPDVFFASVMTPVGGGVLQVFTSDPRIRYDRISARWILIIIDVPCTNASCTTTAANRCLIAVSNTSTITAGTTWTFTQFTGQASRFLDYPTLGLDVNGIYIGGNMFSLAGSYQGTNGYVINRANVMAGVAYTVYTFTSLATAAGSGPYTPQGVDNFDLTATEGYFIGVDNAVFSLLQVRRVSTPAAVPTISANISVTVPTTGSAVNVPNLGGALALDAIDDRLYAAVIRNGRLWTAHAFSVDATGVANTTQGREGCRWYELQNMTTTPALVQSGTIFDNAATAAAARWHWFPTVMVSGQGHSAFAMTTAGSTFRVNAMTGGRLTGDALGTTQANTLVTASSTAYSVGNDRWGDYSYVSLDPLDDMTMWQIHQYCVATNKYGCNVTKLLAPLPATPASCSPASIASGQASVNVVLTGTSVSGTGFYDPGPNMAAPALPFNHISATVTGGVTVNSITYTSPTSITLNLNTTAASAGLQSITVTNPDGQSMASAGGILTITGAPASTSDLAITKTDGVTTYTAGGTTTYTIVASNAGPNTSTGATVTDNFPAGITSVAWTAVYAGGASGPANGAGNISATVTIPVGGTATFTAVCNISAGASGNLVNTATVAVPAGDTDPNPANNSATDTDTQTGSGPVTVTATAGTTGPTPYNTVKLAFDAINAGTHQGAIIVNVNSSTDEGATPAVLNSSGTGSALYTSVLMRPTADGLSVVGSATPASRGVIELNGADNVTIDGDNPNTGGTSRNLTFSLTTTNASVLIWLKTPGAADGCLGNTIKNCNLNGQGTYTTIAGVIAGSTTFGGAALAANSNNTLQNNAITRVQNGLYQNGFATTPYDVNWQVKDNIIGSSVLADKLGFRGMILINASGYLVNNNTIMGISSSAATSSTMTGIQLATGNLNGTISNNKISDIKHNNTTGWGSNGIWLNGSTIASNTNVYNNIISDVASYGFGDVTPTDNGYGLVISAGGGYNVYYNTIVMNTNQTSATGLPAALNVTTGIVTAATLNIRDNLIVNTQTIGTQRYAVYSGAAASVYADINYNDYYFTGPNLGNIGGTLRANLAAWQTGTGKDAQSISTQPYFVSGTDFHLIANSNCAINAKGTPITVPPVTTDIDGDTRHITTPDIGADEFNGDNPAATISYAGSPYCANAGTATVTQTGTPGGTYSSTAGLTINVATGVVTLGTSTPGTYTVTYTVAASGGCSLYTTTTSITITAAPNATISYAGSPYCANAGTAAVTQTGTAGGTYSSTAGLTINAATGAVTLGTSTPGTYTVTYTIAASGGCALYTTTTTITITAVPNATISYAGSPYCANAGTATVTQTGTAGGTYSSTAGLTINSATGAVTLGTSTPGTYTVTYSIAASGGCALFSTTASITVTAVPNATIAYTGSPYCTIAGIATVTQTGTVGGTYSSTAGLTLNAATGDVTLGTSTPGTYTVTYTIAAAGGCAQFTTTATIQIANCAIPCKETFDGVTVPALPAGWFATTGSNGGGSTPWVTTNAASSSVPNSAFTNDPQNASDEYLDTRIYNIAASGTTRLYFQNNYNTEFPWDGMVLEMSVNAGPFTDIITAGGTFVTGGYNGALNGNGNPLGTRQAWTGNSGGFITTSVDLPASANGQNVVFRFRRGTDFSVSATGVYIDDVYAIQVASISYAGSPYCSNGGTATPTVTGSTGGTYSSTAGLSLNAATGVVTLATSTPGTYTVTYTLNSGIGCPLFTTTASITINAAPSATISYAGSPYCQNAGTATVTQTGTAGGTYSSTAGLTLNAATGAVTLGTSTPGTYTVTYTIAAAGGCAVFTTTASITITATPAATIVYAGSPYCSNAGTATVTRTGTAGGTYSAAPAGLTINAATGDVTLGTSTAGTYTVTYTIAAGGGCAVFTTTTSITITAAPAATIAYTGSPYCQNAGTANVTRTGTAGGTYSAAPAGLTINAATGAVTLGTSTPGTYTVTYSIAAGGGCGAFSTSTTITITATPAATISYAGSPYCSTDLTAPVTRTGTAGGTYSSTAGLTINAATGTVTPNTSTPGTYTVTYTIAPAGGCGVFSTTTTITITQAPNAIIFYLGTPYCSNAGTATVSQFGTPGGTYSAAPAGLTINAATGAVTLATSTPGTYTVTYTMAASGGCGITITTTTITITAAPAATITYTGSPYCANAGTANVTRTGTAGGTYSSTAGLSLNAATGAVTLGTSTPGTYTVTYTIAASGGCAVYTTTTTITITALPAATISYAGSPYCSNAGTATVTRTGTAGGVYSSTAGLVINAATGDVNLATSTAGTYTVTYTIAAGGGCPVVTTTTTITITTLPAATISYAGNPYCQNAGTATVTRTGTAGGTYSAAPAGLSIDAVTGTVTLATSTPGTYTVTYTIAAGGGCGIVTATTTITVNSLSVAATAATATPAVLCGPGTVTLAVTGGSLGTGATWKWYSGTCGGTLVGSGATLTLTVNATTTYFVRAEGTCNTSTCASVTVTVNVQPTISIAASPYTALMPPWTTTLTATVTPVDPTNTMIWYRNGNVVTGATALTLVVNSGQLGIYTARTTTTNGCTALSNAVTIKDSSSNKMFITPNPNNGLFTVRYWTGSNTFGFLRHVIMYSENGQRVLDRALPITAPWSNMDIDARHLPKGIYMLMLTDYYGEVLATGKVVLQ